MPASFLSNFTIETGSANALHAPATGSAFAAVSPSAKLIRVKPYISFYASDYNSAGTLYSLFTHRQINSVIVDITFSYHCTCLTDAMTIPSIFATLIAGATNIVQDNVVGTPTVLLDVSKSYIFTNLRIPLPLLTLPILVPDSRSLSNITGSCTAAYTFTYKIKKIIPNSTFIV